MASYTIGKERRIWRHFTIFCQIQEIVDAEICKEFQLSHSCTLFPLPYRIFPRPDIHVYAVRIPRWLISQFVAIHFPISLNLLHSANIYWCGSNHCRKKESVVNLNNFIKHLQELISSQFTDMVRTNINLPHIRQCLLDIFNNVVF